MPATATSQKVASRLKVNMAAGDVPANWPDEPTNWLDMSTYEHVMFVIQGASISNPTISSSANPDGSSPYVVKTVTKAAGVNANSYLVVEASAEQILDPANQHKDQLERYVNVSLGGGTATSVVAIRTRTRFEEEDLTADYTP